MSIWNRIKDKLDFSQSKHTRIDNVMVSELESSREGKYYVIKNPEKAKYLKLSEKDHFIWSSLDGKTTVKDLVVAFFMKYGAFAFERVGSLIQQLKENFFLEETPVHFVQQIKDRLSRRTFEYYLNNFKQIFFQKEVAISGIDRYLTFLYKKFVFLFFTWTAKISYIIISIVGFILFLYIFRSAEYQLLQSAGSYSLGILTLLIISTISIGIHEGAHAFTTKHYGRSVPKGGFLFYLGSPCFFADTTDIWMEPKGRRIAVSWAGPYSDIILASACAVLIYVFPDFRFNNILYKVACMNYLSGFFNLNPLLELDGYFILMDWMEIPLLRKKSFSFLKSEFLKKIFKRERLDRDEKIFTFFGILAFIWTVFAASLSIYFLKFRITRIFHDLVHGTDIVSKIFSAVFLLLFIIPLLLSLIAISYFAVKKVVRVVGRLKLWKSIREIALVLLAISGFVLLCPYFLPPEHTGVYYGIAGIVLWAGALYWGIKAFYAQRGTKFKGMATFSVFLLAVFISSVCSMKYPYAASYFEAAAYLFLAVFVYQILAGLRFSLLSRLEKTLLFLSAPLITAAILFVHNMQPELYPYQYFTLAVGGLALFVFIPSLVTYLKTDFLVPFVLIDAGVAALTLSILSGRPDLGVLSSLFVLSGLLLYNLVHRRFYFKWHPAAEVPARSEKEKLCGGLVNLIENVLLDFTEKYGARAEKAVERSLNDYSKKENTDLSLENKILSIKHPEEKSIIQLGELLSGALDFVTERIMKVTGRRYIEKVLIGARDSLYWEKRELAEQYVFKKTHILKDHLSAISEGVVDKTRIIESIPFFYEVEKKELDRLVSAFRIENYLPGKTIIKQGEQGDGFYVISRGQVSVLVKDPYGQEKEVAALGPGDYFGELSLIENKPRNATVKAVTDAGLLVLEKRDFNCVIKDPFKVQQELKRGEDSYRFLENIPLFAEFPKTQVKFIAGRMRILKSNEGEEIIRQGDVGRTFYVIKEGEFTVEVREEGGKKKVISDLGPGEHFGEIALLIDVPRTAAVTAKTKGELLTLEKGDFDRILGNSLYMRKNLELVSSRRMYDIRTRG